MLLLDRDAFAGARITAGARIALFDRKCTKTAQLDPIATGHRFDDLFEDRVDDPFDIALVKMRVFFR